MMPAACLPVESGATTFPNLTRAPVPWLSSPSAGVNKDAKGRSLRRAMEWHGQGVKVNA